MQQLKNKKLGLLSGLVAFVLMSSSPVVKSDKDHVRNAGQPVYSNFKYTGNDRVYSENPLVPGKFYNTILQGCYPDPSITRKGDDYYLVASSFVMFPGVPIFHSKDMVNWKQIGHVLNRESQLQVGVAGISEGVYAPDIMYNPNNDTFYMITTQFASGIGNMVVKTKDPKQNNWSDPIKLQFEGIDPALFFDDNGKAYVVHNDAPDPGKELYTGHRVIKIWEYDVEKDQVVAGSSKIIVDGGVDLSKKPIWIEAPHIYKKNGKYYLMCAEGGTGGNHSEVIFSSDHPMGPYTPAKKNPILSQRHLAADRQNKVDWAGHADLVQTPNGEWYGVFLAVRPNEQSRVNTGRETFVLPVDWSGEWPVFEGGMEPLNALVRAPKGVKKSKDQSTYFPTGNFTYSDKLNGKKLDDRWIALRGPREKFIVHENNGLAIKPFHVDIKERKPISSLFYRQQHIAFTAEVTMDYVPKSEQDLAGITCLQSEKFNYVFGLTKSGNDHYLLLERTENGVSKVVAKQKISKLGKINLRVSAVGDQYKFSYTIHGDAYENLGGTVSGDILSTDVAGGFTGSMIGLYSTSAYTNNLGK
ncbi:glycoside hydrolase family 43 protein [Sphingobacterium sp. UBA6320]|uniref:glycoside hydrolase family 43 protein n=1 Tax=Sphingobacterium sp. UBA6320 TaxID=1947510 RepID=UPI0025D7294C|nr:glycoside hydrolase family 43 protein [Sphingobacterium sp. UBA6320]